MSTARDFDELAIALSEIVSLRSQLAAEKVKTAKLREALEEFLAATTSECGGFDPRNESADAELLGNARKQAIGALFLAKARGEVAS